MNKATDGAKFQVRENGTDRVMGTYSTKARARSAVDRFDNAYGSYHHHIKEIKAPAVAVAPVSDWSI